MRRLAAGAAVAFLVLVVAVTPLSAVFRPSFFDLRYIDSTGSVVMATLTDSTGLVSAAVLEPVAVPTHSGRTTRLVVTWSGGCFDPTFALSFEAVGDGYRFTAVQTSGRLCQLLTLNSRTVVMALRAPIDAATVEVVND